MKPIVIFVSVLAAVGCGGAAGAPAGGAASMGGPHGCTNIQASCLAPGGHTCEEVGGDTAAVLANTMKSCLHTPGSTWSTSPCDRTASVGGCSLAVSGVCDTIWSFPPIATGDIETYCNGQSQVFVTP